MTLSSCHPVTRQAWGKSNTSFGQEPSPTITSQHGASKRIWRPSSPEKRWRCVGHVLRKDVNSITKVAIHWTPEGNWKRGRPKTTWRRTVEAEMKKMNHRWGTNQRLASDRQGWRSSVTHGCSGRADSYCLVPATRHRIPPCCQTFPAAISRSACWPLGHHAFSFFI